LCLPLFLLPLFSAWLTPVAECQGIEAWAVSREGPWRLQPDPYFSSEIFRWSSKWGFSSPDHGLGILQLAGGKKTDPQQAAGLLIAFAINSFPLEFLKSP
jgi:hypothetical protein